ncbi:hypothetical protein V2J09_019494 [Rumex salicifolius]
MGSGDWLKTIIGKKKGKHEKSKKQMGDPASSKSDSHPMNTSDIPNDASVRNNEANTILISEDIAAIRIQKAYRAYRARKSFLRLKGIARLHKLAKGESIKKQSTGTLARLHARGRIQAQIKERRLCMAAEGHLKQKKLENQLKLEAKLHDLDVEWSDGVEALEEIVTRIHHREEAAVKRERALAYAFNHQWRPNSNSQGVNASEIGKANWEWSWKERWVVARPWEIRVPTNTISPKTPNSGMSNKTNKADRNTNLTSHKSLPVKTKAVIGKVSIKARRLSFPGNEARKESLVP